MKLKGILIPGLFVLALVIFMAARPSLLPQEEGNSSVILQATSAMKGGDLLIYEGVSAPKSTTIGRYGTSDFILGVKKAMAEYEAKGYRVVSHSEAMTNSVSFTVIMSK